MAQVKIASGIRRVRAPVSVMTVILRRVLGWVALQRSRAQLARLDQRLLDDVGLDWSDAHDEAARRVWNAPAHWFDKDFHRGGRAR